MSTPSAQVAGAQDSLETTHYVKQSLLDAKIIYCLAPWIMCGIYDIQVILIFKLIPKFTNYMREGVSVTLSITYTAKQSVLFSKSGNCSLRISHARSARVSHARIFSVFPQSRSPFSASLQTFCLTAHAYLNTNIKYGLFWSLRITQPRCLICFYYSTAF